MDKEKEAMGKYVTSIGQYDGCINRTVHNLLANHSDCMSVKLYRARWLTHATVWYRGDH